MFTQQEQQFDKHVDEHEQNPHELCDIQRQGRATGQWWGELHANGKAASTVLHVRVLHHLSPPTTDRSLYTGKVPLDTTCVILEAKHVVFETNCVTLVTNHLALRNNGVSFETKHATLDTQACHM